MESASIAVVSLDLLTDGLKKCLLLVGREEVERAGKCSEQNVWISIVQVGPSQKVSADHLKAIAARFIAAQTALAWGLVNRVVPASDLDNAIQTYTDVILAHSAATIRLGKAAFYRQIESPLAEAYDVASESMACNLMLDDAAEGMDAFMEKRRAAWVRR